MKKYRIISHSYASPSTTSFLPLRSKKEREKEKRDHTCSLRRQHPRGTIPLKPYKLQIRKEKKMKASTVTVLGTRRGGGPCNKYLLFAISGGGSQVAASQKNDQDVSVWETRYEKRRGYYSITKWIKTEA